jgi:hypothetical protein
MTVRRLNGSSSPANSPCKPLNRALDYSREVKALDGQEVKLMGFI